jgi:hypothetical protein
MVLLSVETKNKNKQLWNVEHIYIIRLPLSNLFSSFHFSIPNNVWEGTLKFLTDIEQNFFIILLNFF